MIKIHVMEKNGTPRELTFDKTLITIGRSARNDVILPRSNVSKNHVNVEVVKDNLVVTDLGSTNGTFVNGQKILKPVIVRPEDSIFVSDFVIKARYEDDDIPEELSGVHEIIEPHADDDLEGATLHSETEHLTATTPPGAGGQAAKQVPVLPAPEVPRIVETKRSAARKKEKRKIMAETLQAAAGPAPGPSFAAPQAADRSSAPSPEGLCAEIYRQIDAQLMLEKLDIHSLGSEEFRKKSSRVIAEVLNSFVGADSLPPSVEPRELSARLQNEVLGLGPLEALLDDPTVREVCILPSGKVIIFSTEGARAVPDPFLSPESKLFVLRKLIFMAGAAVQEGDPIITGTMDRGITVKIISPPLSTDGITVSIQKPPRLESIGMDGLVEKDILSSKMAALFQHCLQMRRGILIADPLGISNRTLMPALASMLPEWERVAVIQCGSEPVYDVRTDMYFKVAAESSEVFTLSKSGENLFSVLPSLQPTAVFIAELSSSQLLKTVRICSSSKTAVVATIREPGPLDCIERLKQLVFNEYPVLDSESMSRLAIEGFSLLVCYSKMMDRTEKVVSISDIQLGKEGKVSLRPVFVYDMKDLSPGGDIWGGFRATRTIPWFIEEKRQRGVNIDVSIFQ
jgi:pilus assembly protein CpaF